MAGFSAKNQIEEANMKIRNVRSELQEMNKSKPSRLTSSRIIHNPFNFQILYIFKFSLALIFFYL